MISDHPMIPVLCQEEIDFPVSEGKDPFNEAIRGQLKLVTDEPKPIPDQLLIDLLRKKRILVIVDHFSEMSENTRSMIRPISPDFSVNALIITSRLEEELDGIKYSIMKPLRIEANRLTPFMHAYLSQLNKRELFNDPEFFEACSGLTRMVDDREVPILWCKLYAEQVILRKEGRVTDELPDTIPDLMLSYLNEINMNIPEGIRLSDPDVHRAAEIVAWRCLKNTFRPSVAEVEAVKGALSDRGLGNSITYLKDRLHLIKEVGPAKDRIRFALDPLAEYLAGLYIVETYADDEGKWNKFLSEVDKVQDAPEAIKGFILSLLDCCLARRAQYGLTESLLSQIRKRLDF